MRTRTRHAWRRRILTAIGMLAAFAALGAVTATPASASGVFSDSFERPVVQPPTFQPYAAGQQIGPWTVTGGGVDLVGLDIWEAADGVQSVDLNAEAPGGVATTFVSLALFQYKVTYKLAGSPFGVAIKTGHVKVDGSIKQTFTFDTQGKTTDDMGYVEKSFFFTGSGLSTTLEFVSTTAGGTPPQAGPVIDDVEVDICVLGVC